MGTVIILAFEANKEGVILETNVPAKLKIGNVKGTKVWVSWDKIGALLFENYTELEGVEVRNSIRNNSSLKEEIEKQYCMPEGIDSKEKHEEYLKSIGYTTYRVRNLKDEKWQVIDDSENVFHQGNLSDCEAWIRLTEKGYL